MRREGLLSFCNGCGMERFGATGGASSSPTKSEGDSADAKQTVLWKEVSEVVISKDSAFF